VDVALRATCSLKPNVTKIHPDEDIGSYASARHYVGQIQPEGVITMDATYEQIPFLLNMAMNYADATSGNGAPYTWTFTLPDDDVASTYLFTLEYTDGGTYVVRCIDVIATALTISGEAGGGWQVEAEIAGGETDLPDALSASPALDDTVTPIKMAETTLLVDADWASIGTSTVTEFISFNWKLENYKHKKQWAGSLWPTQVGYGKWKTTLELVLEVSVADAQTFADALLTTTQYAVRVYGYVDANDSCAIDGMYMVEDVNTIDERDGNNTLQITLVGEKDASDNCGAVTVINDLATM
jgi:hypothetical protein